ncbi:MAG: pantoate--beta-alanine ligase [Bacteroidales bacterium]|nr:pantoate--beta-alanine ligase [Bacteroidales bacterium]
MKVFEQIAPLKEKLTALKTAGNRIGFVPTMGALHQGHLSLVEQSAYENDITVVSIFVNPTQFNDKNDLKNYPRVLDKDIQLLSKYTCIVFAPTEKEIYPETDLRKFEFDGLDLVMEGKFRPGHFNGVAQVVTRLFDIVEPHKAYFGLKDFQQLAIIKHVVVKNKIPVEIVSCPIVRENNGLAMSSRNMRLNEKEKEEAVSISRVLFYIHDHFNEFIEYEDIKYFVARELEKKPDIRLEYFEIVNTHTLQEIKSLQTSEPRNACIAAWVGNVRLIDNIDLN